MLVSYKRITLLDLEDGGGYKIGSHKQEIIDILTISSKNAVISWSVDGTIKLWDLKNSICLMTYIFKGVENIYKISDSKYISISSNKKYRILELENF